MFPCSRWPLVMDTTGQASVFLKYRDVNFVCAVSQGKMDPEIIRKAVLGAVRYVVSVTFSNYLSISTISIISAFAVWTRLITN